MAEGSNYSQNHEKLVFVSYSSQDKDFVEKLTTDLKKYKLPLWFDKWEIKVGDSIVEKINSALGKITDLILILSSNSINSNWVKKELSSALMIKLKDNSVKVLPCRVDDCEIPPIINDIKYADFRENYEDSFLDLVEGLNLTIMQGELRLDTQAYVKALMQGRGSIIETIREAGRRRKLLWLVAREEDGSIEPRKVAPYSFRDRGKNRTLLFFAEDIRKNQIRAFRVDRITSVTILNETFRPRFPVEF